MNYESFIGGEQKGFAWVYDGWRCVYCGEVVDPLILRNRMRMRALETKPNRVHAGHFDAETKAA